MTDVNISAIVPCYNNKEELILTLYSLEQVKANYFDIEIIIIDGSEKKLIVESEVKRCISKINKEGIKTKYISGKDWGPYDAMNKGIQNISSYTNWIWFMNSGDEALNAPRKLSFMTKFGVIIGCWYGKKNRNKLIIPKKEMGLAMTRSSRIGNGICHQAMLFNIEKYGEKLYNWEKFKYAAELDYYVDSIICEDYLVDKNFRCNYDNSKGFSQKNAIDHLKEQYIILGQRGIKTNNCIKAKCVIKLWIQRVLSMLRKSMQK